MVVAAAAYFKLAGAPSCCGKTPSATRRRLAARLCGLTATNEPTQRGIALHHVARRVATTRA
jgi:hypothetical protein